MSWRGFDHGTIYEMVVNGGHGIGIADAAETAWGAANTAINDAEQEIGAALHASQAEWQGTGADAMRTSYSPLMQWAVQAATSAAKTASGVGDQAVVAMETQRLVADNPPPQNLGQHLHSFFGGLDGDGVYLDQAAAVDRLMMGYENSSVANEERFSTWSVPPTVVVTPAAAGPSGPGGPGGVGAVPDTGGLGPGGGSIAAALAPGGGVPGGGAPGGAGLPGPVATAPGGAGPGGGAGVLPGGVGAAPGGVGAPVAGATGAGGQGAGRSPVGTPGTSGVGSGATGTGMPGSAGAGSIGAGTGGSVAGGRGLGTGGVAHPSQRPLGSPGGSGTGPGPWSRAGTGAGGAATGATALRPSVPGVAPRASAPDWRSVLLPPEREAAPPSRAPGETAARSAGPGAPGGSTATPAAAPGSGTRGAGSAGVHGAPMMGGGAGGAQPEGRRRASYLIDDSDAFVDKRWFTEPVITPDDPL